MKVAILSRPGDCFPNIIATGLSEMLKELNVESKIFYDAIPYLMRLLPFSEKPKRWSNNFHFRVYNKLKNYKQDKALFREISQYEVIILAECLPNAFWKNFLAIETFKKKLGQKPVIPYLDAFIGNAPLHTKMWFDGDDYSAERYVYHLCPAECTEISLPDKSNWKAIGINISRSGLHPVKKNGFTAVVDFAQNGYESYRQQQLSVLQELGINTIVLEGRYPIAEIREIYKQASVFFLAFPETYGLPIAECLASGSYIFTPDSGWPMSWRLNKDPMPWGPGTLPECFKVYNGREDLSKQLIGLRNNYDTANTPVSVHDCFMKYYRSFYYGDSQALLSVLKKFGTV